MNVMGLKAVITLLIDFVIVTRYLNFYYKPVIGMVYHIIHTNFTFIFKDTTIDILYRYKLQIDQIWPTKPSGDCLQMIDTNFRYN